RCRCPLPVRNHHHRAARHARARVESHPLRKGGCVQVIPAAFDYELAESVEHAVQLLSQHGEDAKLLAGGHSLLPLMRLRLARPSVLIDIDRLSDLAYIRDV